MTRILLTGASGLLGLNLALAVDGKKHQVIGVANTLPFKWVNFTNLQAELTEAGILEHLFDEIHPEVVIHCAAIANVDDCESKPELAESINTMLPGKIAGLAAQHKAKMVQISTDAVFDGEKGNYLETDSPNPLSVYAATKLGGEKAVALANPDALIARVNFYGWSMTGKRSLAEWFVSNLAAGTPIKGFDDVLFCPMMVLDLVDILMKAIALDLKGVYHVVGAQSMSKFAYGQAIAAEFGFDPKLLTPISVNDAGLKAARSHNLTLSTDKLVAALGHPLPDFNSGLQKYHDQYRHGFPQFLKTLS
jgi:dTDP-4-dehydrorhamnose reductase